jgi:hypothetical protein
MSDIKWVVPMSSGNHVIEFSHGTTTGSRLIKVDGKEVVRHDWMFRLVGEETFTVGPKKVPARLKIEAVGGVTYTYKLYLKEKLLEKYAREAAKNMLIWKVILPSGLNQRIAIEKDTLDIWVGNEKIEAESGFTDNGSEQLFVLEGKQFQILVFTSGKKNEGIIHQLIYDGELCVPQDP